MPKSKKELKLNQKKIGNHEGPTESFFSDDHALRDNDMLRSDRNS